MVKEAPPLLRPHPAHLACDLDGSGAQVLHVVQQRVTESLREEGRGY